jgi:hypothetical protein
MAAAALGPEMNIEMMKTKGTTKVITKRCCKGPKHYIILIQFVLRETPA